MTNLELKETIDRLRNLFNSGKIQEAAPDRWLDLEGTQEGLSFNVTYRIKPKPREVFCFYDSAGNFKSVSLTSPNQISPHEHHVVRFREVIDE